MLLFTDESQFATGRRHFFSYTYGPSFTNQINPAGLKTDAGIGVGSTVADCRRRTRTLSSTRGDDFGGPNFFINDGLGRISHRCQPDRYGDLDARRTGLWRVVVDVVDGD